MAAKTEAPCHSTCGTIKIPPYLEAVDADHRPFSSLWRFHMRTYERNILERHVQTQTNKQTSKARGFCEETVTVCRDQGSALKYVGETVIYSQMLPISTRKVHQYILRTFNLVSNPFIPIYSIDKLQRFYWRLRHFFFFTKITFIRYTRVQYILKFIIKYKCLLLKVLLPGHDIWEISIPSFLSSLDFSFKISMAVFIKIKENHEIYRILATRL